MQSGDVQICTAPELRTCWACEKQLRTPHTAFKCGWCGAITDASVVYQARDQTRRLSLLGQRGFVLAILTLISADTLVGFIWIQPALYEGTALKVHQVLGIWLACNVFLNYTSSALRSPGRSADYLSLQGPAQAVSSGQYNDFTYCSQCQLPKAPQAHHCRTCRCCIMEMDHHCAFLATCVGRNNLRHFLLFLGWLVLGAAYLAACTLSVIYNRRHDVRQYLQWSGSRSCLLGIGLKTTLAAPGWLQAAIFVLSTCCAALIGVAPLLYSQMTLVMKGQTYVDALKHSTRESSLQHTHWSARLQAVFGPGSPVTWVMPRWQTELDVLRKEHVM